MKIRTSEVSPYDPGNVGSEGFPFLMRDELGMEMKSTEFEFFSTQELVHRIDGHHNWMLFERPSKCAGLTRQTAKTVLSNRDGRACACLL